jgi:addiction module HigA family antidote
MSNSRSVDVKRNAEMGREPASPGEVLRDDILKTIDVTQDKLAKAIGMSRLSINQLFNGKRSVTAEMALRLAKATETSAEFWLNLQNAVDLYRARRKLEAELTNIPSIVSSKKLAVYEMAAKKKR